MIVLAAAEAHGCSSQISKYSMVKQLRSRSSLRQHCDRRPFHAKHISNSNYGSPRRSGRQHKPAAEYWKLPPAAPGAPLSSDRGRSGRHCLQSCNLGRGMFVALQVGVERGQALPPHGMAHHFGLLAHQPAAAWPCCSRLVPFCQGSQLMLQTPVAALLLLKTT